MQEQATDMRAEQQARFTALAGATSESLAYFYCCIAFDIPFDMHAIPADDGTGEQEKWRAYMDYMEKKNLLEGEDGRTLGFLDGLTDITRIFGVNLREGEFSRVVALERSAQEVHRRKPGTEKQRKAWGEGTEKRPFTQEDYAELDRIYTALSADLVAAGGVSAKQEFVLRNCSKWTLDMNRAVAAGSVDKAVKLNRIIQDSLASEQLRKRDAKPLDDIRLDSITEKLEQAGLLKKGRQCEPDEMFRILFGRPPKYPYTKDAAEQMILINENRMRTNDGQPELSTLPPEMRLKDDLGEFAEAPNEKERDAYEKLGLIKMPPAAQGKKTRKPNAEEKA